MTTVFLSGSRRLSRINEDIRRRLVNMIDNGHNIVIGDANGADKAMQTYLAKSGYENVTVFCAGEVCRNNLGGWSRRNILVDSQLKGREFYAQKDKEMAQFSDFGFVLWDGQSAGSVANILELLKMGKSVVVYYGPEKRFHNLRAVDDFLTLLSKCTPETLETINKKVRLERSLREMSRAKQASLEFS